jgi:hypothetical protein
MIGVLRGVELLKQNIFKGMRRAGYSPEVIFSIQESGDYRRGFADGWKTRTGRLHSVAKNKGMRRAGCIAD